MELGVTSGVLATLIEEAARAHPAECCGLLLGGADGAVGQAQAAANVHPDPLTHFEIDPAALIAAHRAARAGGPRLLGYYHSHPNGHPRPSATDCEHAGGDGAVWAIVAAGVVSFWRDDKSGFEPLSYRLIEG
ncbi:MAG: M67 family metallopeptidase [Sphingomonadales bacterium]|nr:M67 family metallopeptidase [Sphingomonadales bacterium]